MICYSHLGTCQIFYTANLIRGRGYDTLMTIDLEQCEIKEFFAPRGMGQFGVKMRPDKQILTADQVCISSIPNYNDPSKDNSFYFCYYNVDPFIMELESYTFDYKGLFYIAGEKLLRWNQKDGIIVDADTLVNHYDRYKRIEAISLYRDHLYGIARADSLFSSKFDFIEIDLKRPDSIIRIFPLDIKSLEGFELQKIFLNTSTINCDSVRLFLTASDDRFPVITDIFEIFPEQKKYSRICSFTQEKWKALRGITNIHETDHTRCILALDLDENNTTEPTNGYFYKSKCPTDTLRPYDDDFFIYAKDKIDSATIEFIGIVPDGQDEQIVHLLNEPDIAITRNQNHHLAFRNKGNANTMHWRSLLMSVRYIHPSRMASGGPRRIRFKIYSGLRVEEADFDFTLPQLYPAGKNATFYICPSDAPIELFVGLDTIKSNGGYWLELQTDPNKKLLYPGKDSSGKYTYILTRPNCYSDTAYLNLKYHPLPIFNLGNDTTLCKDDKLVLNTHTNFDIPRWQDGKKRFTFTVDQKGLYWAEVRDTNWCVFRDSIQVDYIDTMPSKSRDEFICANTNFVYKNKLYQIGDSIIDILPAVEGCDTLQVIYIKESSTIKVKENLEVCKGKKSLYRGQIVQGDSTYIFNFGSTQCDTILELKVTAIDGILVKDTIYFCGENTKNYKGYTVKPDLLYRFQFTNQTEDCDTIILLNTISIQQNSGEEEIYICPNEKLFYRNIWMTPNQIYEVKAPSLSPCDSIITIYTKDYPIVKSNIEDIDLENPETVIQRIILSQGKLVSFSITPMKQIEIIDSNSFRINATETQQYTISFTDENGCQWSESFFVFVNNEAQVYVPNSFSPNDDRLNDLWQPIASPFTEILECSIYSKWENRIFSSTSIIPSWDGNFNGKKCIPGVYVYLIKYKGPNGLIKIATGDVNLLR